MQPAPKQLIVQAPAPAREIEVAAGSTEPDDDIADCPF
jgi:hypothetical protein